MTLVTNMAIERTIPENCRCEISAYDISRGIPNSVNFGSDVSISWDGNARQIMSDLQGRGITVYPCQNRPVRGDSIAIIIAPISCLLLIRLM